MATKLVVKKSKTTTKTKAKTAKKKVVKAPATTTKYFTLVANTENSEIKITNSDLVDYLQRITDCDSLYDMEPRISLSDVMPRYSMIKSHANRGDESIKALYNWMTEENLALLSKIENMRTSGVISFDALLHLYTQGTEIITMNNGRPIGGIVVSAEYQRSFMGTFLLIKYEYVDANGKQFMTKHGTSIIGAYAGVRTVDSLDIRPITFEEKLQLEKRGEKFSKLAIGSHYYSLAGRMEIKSWWHWTEIRATGRCMVDTATYFMFKEGGRGFGNDDENVILDTISESDLWRTSSYVYGFSFVTKQWGRFDIESLNPIEFREHAFDQLVLDHEKKNLIKSLVVDSGSGFKDIIDSKGGGCIFLLHGEPGVGKTLTAEAIAELLKRPLYSVAVGELGTNTNELEKNLRQILDVSQIWNAVILIDEADIFLEKRTEGDILRNAMVGIFLRLLEYHQGVLFLTTNRVKEFDVAFHSRISIALKYNKLDAAARKTVWDNLLEAAGVNGLNTDELSEIDINGRQIKNTIRLAQGLARQEGVPVSKDHILTTVSVAKQFQTDLKG